MGSAEPQPPAFRVFKQLTPRQLQSTYRLSSAIAPHPRVRLCWFIHSPRSVRSLASLWICRSVNPSSRISASRFHRHPNFPCSATPHHQNNAPPPRQKVTTVVYPPLTNRKSTSRITIVFRFVKVASHRHSSLPVLTRRSRERSHVLFGSPPVEDRAVGPSMA
jgi:hypothetical protein